MLQTDQSQVATWGAAFLLGISLGRLIGQWRSRAREPRLHGAAANAGKARAAARAVETLEAEEGRLFADELAVALAGQAAFAAALKAAQPRPQGPGRRLYTVSPLAAATWWVDRALLTALTTPAIPATKGWLSARLTLSARGPSAPPRQVVLLGAGMDTRAWRLPLPPGIRWFELDRGEVLAAKRRALAHSGAEVAGEGAGPAQHQLRCEAWTAVAADLKQPREAADALLAAGFDLEAPTVWVAEGALEFLEEGEAAAALAAAAGASAQGSTFIGHALTEEGLAAAREGRGNGGGAAAALPPAAVKAWASALPVDPSPALEAAGWTPQTVATLGEVGAQACGGETGGFAAPAAAARSEAFFTAKIQ